MSDEIDTKLNSKISSFIGPLTDDIINNFIRELKKKKHRDKIMKNIIDPLLTDINSKYYPYLMMLTIFLVMIIILLILLLFMNTYGSRGSANTSNIANTPNISSISNKN